MDGLTDTTGDRLKAIVGELVDRVELKFDWGKWGSRRVRLVCGGSIYLKTTILTTDNRGDPICTLCNNLPTVHFKSNDIFAKPMTVAS